MDNYLPQSPKRNINGLMICVHLDLGLATCIDIFVFNKKLETLTGQLSSVRGKLLQSFASHIPRKQFLSTPPEEGSHTNLLMFRFLFAVVIQRPTHVRYANNWGGGGGAPYLFWSEIVLKRARW